MYVSKVIVVIVIRKAPATPRHPPQRHVEQPAVPGRRAGRAAGRRNHALLRDEVDGPDRGDTVDEETAKRKGEDAPRRANGRRVRARPAVAERIGARNSTGGAVLREIMRLGTHFWARRVWVDFRKVLCYTHMAVLYCI